MCFLKSINKRILLTGLLLSLFSYSAISLAAITTVNPNAYVPRYTAMSIVSPTGYGLGWGQIGIGAGYVNHWIDSSGEDGYAVASMGFGNPYKVALTASVLVDSLGANDDSFGENGTLAFKLSHEWADGLSAVAIGVGNAVPWGALDDDAYSFYAVGTHVFNLSGDPSDRLDLVVSLGAGSGAFHSPEAFRNGEEDVKPFGSMALRFLPQAALIADWAADNLALGVSVAPFKQVPLVLGASVLNVAGENTSPTTFLLTAGIGFNFIH